MKKLLLITVGLVLASSLAVFATETNDQDITKDSFRRPPIEGMRIPPLMKLAEKAAEMNMTIEEYETYLKEQHEARLSERAEELGISVDELKAQLEEEKTKMKAMTPEELREYLQEKRDAHLEEKAEELGLSVEEFKAQIQEERESRLEERAKELGITVEELKSQTKTSPPIPKRGLKHPSIDSETIPFNSDVTM